METLKNKTALVTGASRGIGRIIAQTLARHGAQVIVNYHSNADAAQEVVQAIEAAGGQAKAIKANVGKPEEMAALFDQSIEAFGKVDILVNNAGIALYRKIQDTTEEEFDRVFNTNVKGVYFALKEAATKLAEGGRIVNLSTSVTRLMLPTYGAYSSSKAAVEQLTRVFAKEVGARKITVNSVSPGPVNTELFTEGKTQEAIDRLAGMSAFNRIGEPEDIANVVLFLVSDAAAWVTGQNLGANGGFA